MNSTARYITPKPHIVFQNDLSLGVAAVARALARRQHLTPEFPCGASVAAILYVCEQAEHHIKGLDMGPIRERVASLELAPIRADQPTDHDRLTVLCELTLGQHLVPARDAAERRRDELETARLYAALHIALTDHLLPVGNWAASEVGGTVVGCSACIRAQRNTRALTALPELLGMAVRDGELDPLFVIDPSARGRALARLTWTTDFIAEAEDLVERLRRLGFDAAVNLGYGTVVAQKPMFQHDINHAMRWGARFCDPHAWCGAETVYTTTRPPVDVP